MPSSTADYIAMRIQVWRVGWILVTYRACKILTCTLRDDGGTGHEKSDDERAHLVYVF